MIKWALIGLAAACVSYHFWPTATKHVGGKIVDSTVAASKAGYEAASK